MGKDITLVEGNLPKRDSGLRNWEGLTVIVSPRIR